MFSLIELDITKTRIKHKTKFTNKSVFFFTLRNIKQVVILPYYNKYLVNFMKQYGLGISPIGVTAVPGG